MDNKQIWVNLIRSVASRVVQCDPNKLIVVAECKGCFYQAKLILPQGKVIYGEPSLSEDGAFEYLLLDMKREKK